MKYRFITFEGGEGSGKGTQIRKVKAFLENKGYKVTATKEPGATNIGRQLRKILLDPRTRDLCPESELLLYIADRMQHINTVVKPALMGNKIVLCDRYHDSTLAYQLHGRGMNSELIGALQRLLRILKPDITFYLDLPCETGLKRSTTIEFVKPDRMEQESMEFHKRLRQGYIQIASSDPGRVKLIDATKSMDHVFSEILGYLDLAESTVIN